MLSRSLHEVSVSQFISHALQVLPTFGAIFAYRNRDSYSDIPGLMSSHSVYAFYFYIVWDLRNRKSVEF